MLEIIIQGEPLELKSDMTFEYNIKNPFFEDKVIPVPATYSFAVPLTPRNNRLLRYPLRMNQTEKVKEFDAVITFGSITIAKGVLVLKKAVKKGSINLFFKAQADEGLLDKPLCDLPLKEYALNDGDYLENLHNICERSFEKEEPFALPMVRITPPSEKVALFGLEKCSLDEKSRIFREHFNRKLKGGSPNVSYINPYHFYHQTLLDGNKYYAVKKEDKYLNRIAPFPFLWHIMDVVLSSLGINKNPFKDGGDLESIIVSATYCPPDKEISIDDNFKINKSLSDINTGDFIKEVLKAFGFSLNRLRGKTNIVSYDEMLQQTPIADWSNLLIDGWSIERAKQEELVSGIESERIIYGIENSEERILRTVEYPYDVMYYLYLMANNLKVNGVKYKKEDINSASWYITSTNEYYDSYFDSGDYWCVYRGVEPSFVFGNHSYNLKKKERKADLKVPIMIVDMAWDLFLPDFTELPVNGEYVGDYNPKLGNKGITNRFVYIPFVESDLNARSFSPALLSYQGKESSYIPIPEDDDNVAPHPRYPFANTNGCGVFSAKGFNFDKVKDFSITAKSFFLKERNILKGKVLLSERQIRELSGVDVVLCNGKRWLLKEVRIPIKLHKIYPAQFVLVEIPELENLSFPDLDIWA